ncbi:MAG: hypothetical protein WBH40_08105 [Ignavibacteriaceae bacterium]
MTHSASLRLTGYKLCGVYFHRLQAVPTGRQAGPFVETKKMVLMK